MCTVMEENKADRLLLEVIHWNYIDLLKAKTRLPVSNHGGLTCSIVSVEGGEWPSSHTLCHIQWIN